RWDRLKKTLTTRAFGDKSTFQDGNAYPWLTADGRFATVQKAYKASAMEYWDVSTDPPRRQELPLPKETTRTFVSPTNEPAALWDGRVLSVLRLRDRTTLWSQPYEGEPGGSIPGRGIPDLHLTDDGGRAVITSLLTIRVFEKFETPQGMPAIAR